MTQTNEQWAAREKELVDELDGRIKFYVHWCEVNRKWQRATAIAALVCSILAPISVISKPGFGIGIFGLGEDAIRGIALILTLILGLTEGLRRIFRFEHRWHVCALCREKLLQLRALYLDNQIGVEIGSDDWTKNLSSARKRLTEIVNDHVEDFAKMLKEAEGSRLNRRRRISN